VYNATFIKYREKYFKKYLIKEMILTTSPKNIKKFQLIDCDCWYTNRFSWESAKETLNIFKSSLYIEDTKTHTLFNYMANRFFEGLFCNCAVFFDRSCINTIKKDRYVIPKDFMIDSYEELMDKTQNIDPALVDNFLTTNTVYALDEKAKCLHQIEQFLLNY
jgi:hypothetical protein